MHYKNYEELKEKLLYKRIISFDEDSLKLDDVKLCVKSLKEVSDD